MLTRDESLLGKTEEKVSVKCIILLQMCSLSLKRSGSQFSSGDYIMFMYYKYCVAIDIEAENQI